MFSGPFTFVLKLKNLIFELFGGARRSTSCIAVVIARNTAVFLAITTAI